MRFSIRTKLLTLCIILVLLTTAGMSGTYYILTKRDKHRESRQRIQIAFDIILDDFHNSLDTYTERLEEFLKEDTTLRGATYSYTQNTKRIQSISFLATYMTKVTSELKKFGSIISAHQLSLYGTNKRLLAAYQVDASRESLGAYVVSEAGNDTFLALGEDSPHLTSMLIGEAPIPDEPLPDGISASYDHDIPDAISTMLFTRDQRLGIQITAPISHLNKQTGILVCEVFYSQDLIERYAMLSKTDVNLFTHTALSLGTLAEDTELSSEALNKLKACELIAQRGDAIDILPVEFATDDYYQGRCAFTNSQGAVGALSISLSQELEHQEIRKLINAVLIISAIAIGVAFLLILAFSQRAIHSIRTLVDVIGAAASGDLRTTATVFTRDEFGMLSSRLNQMITQLRGISRQVQDASNTVSTTADKILFQTEALTQHVQQQSSSVDSTTNSVETINHFIDVVAHNSNSLHAAGSQILSSIQQSRASINEVTSSTGNLSMNLQRISNSVDKVNDSTKQMADYTDQLVETSEQTQTEMHQIDQALRDVSQNADLSQQLARETMEAALSGQTSSEASIQGMQELKDVVAQIAQTIEEISSWGAQVSSILDIVDEITEQTSLLALNASIISAQAGQHGRGFAVVAEEIKNLATRTKNSTKEIASLIHTLQEHTEIGVKKAGEGIEKMDQNVQLASTVKHSLETIIERATRSSEGVTSTAQVIQHMLKSSGVIRSSIDRVNEMVSHIQKATQEQESDTEQVATAVENIYAMAEQVNRASIEQKKAAEQIEHSMAFVMNQFSDISTQTEELQQTSNHIVADMHTIESTTEDILQNTRNLSGATVKQLLEESKMLQKIVTVFKVS